MIVNCTPHRINFNNRQVLEPSGIVARVFSVHTRTGSVAVEPCLGGIDEHEHRVYCGCPCQEEGWTVPSFSITFGEIVDLPEPAADTIFVVAAIVKDAAKALGRTDVCSPATGHPDCVRNDKGQIVSVPGLVF